MSITKECVLGFIDRASAIMDENKDYLIELDAASGDGDLGLTMSKGFAAGKEAAFASEETDLGKLLFQVGSAMAAAVPSTMGTLMSSGFLGAAKAWKGKEELPDAAFADFCQAYFEGVQKRGKANPGERTLLDSLKPAADAVQAAVTGGETGLQALTEIAYAAAQEGVEATKEMAPVHGKAFVHREKLSGVPDQGAIVGSLLYQAWKDSVA